MPIRWMGAVGVTPDWQVLAEVEVASDCDYVDFTELDINRDWEYYLDVVIKNPTDSYAIYYLFVEDDYTLTSYYNQSLFAHDTTIIATRDNNPEIASSKTGDRVLSNIRITKDPDGYFRYTSFQSRESSPAITLRMNCGMKTAPVSDITSLRVSASVSGAIGAGSRFILARPRS